MKNIKPYDKCSFSFFESIRKSKKNSTKNPNYTTRLSAMLDKVNLSFDEYDTLFQKNDLCSLSHLWTLNSQNEEDLKNLYSYKQPTIKKLLEELTTLPSTRRFVTCQNCTINEVNSFDHYVNKNEFAVYSVHPKNLFPSCTRCNSLKGSNWRENDSNLFLNLYLDTLPFAQYLFADVVYDNNMYSLIYYLKNIDAIDTDLFDQINSHYSKLDLLSRFQENSDLLISTLEHTISSNLSNSISLSTIIGFLKEECSSEMKFHGNNYWKSISKLSLIDDSFFLKQFQ